METPTREHYLVALHESMLTPGAWQWACSCTATGSAPGKGRARLRHANHRVEAESGVAS